MTRGIGVTWIGAALAICPIGGHLRTLESKSPVTSPGMSAE